MALRTQWLPKELITAIDVSCGYRAAGGERRTLVILLGAMGASKKTTLVRCGGRDTPTFEDVPSQFLYTPPFSPPQTYNYLAEPLEESSGLREKATSAGNPADYAKFSAKPTARGTRSPIPRETKEKETSFPNSNTRTIGGRNES